jgi:hypothetical protein
LESQRRKKLEGLPSTPGLSMQLREKTGRRIRGTRESRTIERNISALTHLHGHEGGVADEGRQDVGGRSVEALGVVLVVDGPLHHLASAMQNE